MRKGLVGALFTHTQKPVIIKIWKHSCLLLIKKTQIKAMIRYHFTPIRLTTFSKPNNILLWPECQEQSVYCYSATMWLSVVKWKVIIPKMQKFLSEECIKTHALAVSQRIPTRFPWRHHL